QVAALQKALPNCKIEWDGAGKLKTPALAAGKKFLFELLKIDHKAASFARLGHIAEWATRGVSYRSSLPPVVQ
ncbi:MAG TPA: hypothetical protein VIK18_22520, partial [Pirellulales bacterium]